jgi:mono/diheme cytochrome c family protein
VGGGFYLPIAEAKARREGRDDWMRVIRGHARFFLILTGVFGAVSGVGIWFSIGLAQPEGTSTLIHNFVFGWAIEWVFFIVELTAAAVYYYTWDKIPARQHMIVGWIYAISAWMSLVIINGILTFMLTPGGTWLAVAGSGQEASVFWNAFFNPTYWPSLILRTLVMISLAGIFALFTASRIDGYAEPRLKREIVRWSAKWLIPAFVLMPVAFLWYLRSVPAGQRQLLNLGISTIGQGTFTQVTRSALVTIMISATIALIVYIMAYRTRGSFSTGWAWAVLLLALGATAATEQSREMLRKPFVIVDHMYSNGIRRAEVERFNREGYLTRSVWLRQEERVALNGDPAAPRVLRSAAGEAETVAIGQLMFGGQCLSCHTVDGYRPMRRLLQGRDRGSIANLLQSLHENKEDSPYRAFMPPLVGTAQERDALADYLASLVRMSGPTVPPLTAEHVLR